LGGGVVTDMGAFAATAFKRGMHFVLIPTSLLAMVDAAIGGKAAVNFGDIKNQIGLFTTPDQIYVFPDFLQTLPHRQKLSGYAEMIKHALLHSRDLFDTFIKINSPEKACTEEAIIESAGVKQSFVKNDITETGIRKVLNLGHTIGHALESYTLKNDAKPLLHGEAIAVGLICESFISMRMAGFSESDLRQLASLINWQFPHYRFAPGSADELIRIMGHDKKNNNGQKLNFSLLKNVGEPVIDQVPGERLIRESLHFYTNLQVGFFV
jgi:3-dehydroquinate synthase